MLILQTFHACTINWPDVVSSNFLEVKDTDRNKYYKQSIEEFQSREAQNVALVCTMRERKRCHVKTNICTIRIKKKKVSQVKIFLRQAHTQPDSCALNSVLITQGEPIIFQLIWINNWGLRLTLSLKGRYIECVRKSTMEVNFWLAGRVVKKSIVTIDWVVNIISKQGMLKGCTREVVLIASLKLDGFERLKIRSLQLLIKLRNWASWIQGMLF